MVIMKNISRFVLVFFCILLCSFPIVNHSVSASSNEPIRVYVHGSQIQFTQLPILEDGNTLVELRPIFDALGFQVQWNGETQTITSTLFWTKIVMKVNSTEASVYEESVTLPIAPRIIQDTVFVPLRFIVDSIGGDLTWDENENRVDIVADNSYYTYLAAMSNDMEQVKYWLTHDAGANFTIPIEGPTILSAAMRHKNLEMIELLLKYGADPNLSSVGSNESVIPLVSAISDKDPVVVQLLLDYGADVSDQAREGSALDFAKTSLQKETNEADRQNLLQIITSLEKTIQQDTVSLSEQRVLIPFDAGNKKINLFDGEMGTWGYLDKTGNVAIKPKFSYVSLFSEGLAYAESKDTRQRGYINRTGKFILTFDYMPNLFPGDFTEGLAPIGKNDKWGFIDKSGAFVIAPEYDGVNSFSEGFASVRKNNKYGVINRTGEMVVEPTYEYIFPFRNGLALVRGNHSGFINTKGDLVIDFQKLGIEEVGEFSGEYAPVSKDGKDGFINAEGQFVIPPIYTNVTSFREGLAGVSVNGKYGFIDVSGQMVIPPQFEYAFSFRNGQAFVKQKGKWGFINRKGDMIVPAAFDGFDDVMGNYPLTHYKPFSDQTDRITMLHKGDKIYYVLPDGTIIESQVS